MSLPNKIPYCGLIVWNNSRMPTTYFPSQVTAISSRHPKIAKEKCSSHQCNIMNFREHLTSRSLLGRFQLVSGSCLPQGSMGDHFLWSQSGGLRNSVYRLHVLDDLDVLLTDKVKAEMLSFPFFSQSFMTRGR